MLKATKTTTTETATQTANATPILRIQVLGMDFFGRLDDTVL